MPKLEALDQALRRGGGRRARGGRVSSSLAEINVVPLIDVMLVLLVIFRVTAPMMQQGFPGQLPESLAPPSPPSAPVPPPASSAPEPPRAAPAAPAPAPPEVPPEPRWSPTTSPLLLQPAIQAITQTALTLLAFTAMPPCYSSRERSQSSANALPFGTPDGRQALVRRPPRRRRARGACRSKMSSKLHRTRTRSPTTSSPTRRAGRISQQER
jgi:hypothetical protein